MGRASFSWVCWPLTSSPSLAHSNRGLAEKGSGRGNAAKSYGISAKCGLSFSPYLCYWLIYNETLALWVLTYLFYRKCARGWDELWDLPKVTLRVISEMSNWEMTREMVCVLGRCDAARVSSSPNPEPEQSFCKAFGWSPEVSLSARARSCPQAFTSLCVPFAALPPETLGEYLLNKCMNGRAKAW